MAVRVGYHRSPVQAGLDSVAPYDHESSVCVQRTADVVHPNGGPFGQSVFWWLVQIGLRF